jgi:hypothetical protein
VIAKELKEDKHELAIWQLADDGWKAVLRARLTRMQETRARNLNTPKAANIKALFAEALGIDDVTEGWKWRGMSPSKAATKLDGYITLRGEIAHRSHITKAVYKYQVQEFLNHVKRLVAQTGGEVNRHVKGMTGKALW